MQPQPNLLLLFVSAFVPMIVGFIWYNPKVFGTAWMQASGMTPEKAKASNMLVVFGLSFLFALFLSLEMMFLVIHQTHLSSILMNEPDFHNPNGQLHHWYLDFMEQHGKNFRTFKHGALHGTIAGILLALPIVGTNALFEQKGWKYIWINAGYWTVSFALMGGVICAFA